MANHSECEGELRAILVIITSHTQRKYKPVVSKVVAGIAGLNFDTLRKCKSLAYQKTGGSGIPSVLLLA